MEQRLIDANAFKKYLKEKYKEVKDQFQTEKMRSLAQTITNDFCSDIDEQPTVDAVPVVLCGECECGTPDEDPQNDGKKYVWCKLWHAWKPEDGFCDVGERKDGESDGET